MGDSLFKELARFLRVLPPKSKQHIWEHAVKIKTSDGKKQICDSTRHEGHIDRLLCGCVIVYVRYLDRNRAPLKIKEVRPHIQHVSIFILHGRHYPMQRSKFENDRNYFPAILEDYIQV